jgi:hypothetical protein
MRLRRHGDTVLAAEIGRLTDELTLRIAFIAICAAGVFDCGTQDRVPQRDSTFARVPDSAALATYEDSALANSPMSENDILLANGDTLRLIGSTSMDQKEAKGYGVDLYIRNSVYYLRVDKLVSRTPQGKAISSTLARVRLPQVDSTDEVITEGLCSVNDISDPLVFGIVSPDSYGVQWQASHAWRFDAPTETLREIPVLGVKCAQWLWTIEVALDARSNERCSRRARDSR